MGRDNKGGKKVSVSLENDNRVNREEMPTNYGKSQVTGVAEAKGERFWRSSNRVTVPNVSGKRR